jgi:DNA polymerase III sliding clamp (beta) subunit (PCNA family)
MILPDSKIEKAKAKANGSRPMLESVYLDVENRRLLACDGFKLAVVPVETHDGDQSGPITDDALKMARAGGRSATRQIDFENGSYKFENGSTLPRPPVDSGAYSYPDVDQIIPNMENKKKVVDCPNCQTPVPTEATVTFGISAKKLYELAQAICENKRGNELHIQLTVASPSQPILVEPARGRYHENTDWTATGVIMPVSIEV